MIIQTTYSAESFATACRNPAGKRILRGGGEGTCLPCAVVFPFSSGQQHPSQSSVMQAEDSWPLLHPRFSSFATVPLAQAAALCGAAAACLATRRRTMRRAEQAWTLLVTTEIGRAPAML